MNEFPNTNASLVARIKDPGNVEAWESFEKIYRPVIFRIARAKGLQYADAVDLVQQVLISVAAAIHAYEKRDDETPFRNWLSRITRNAILKALTRQPKDRADGGTQVLDVLSQVPAADQEADSMIELEVRREIFHAAAQKVRESVQPTTWLAFELTVLQGNTIEKAANKLQLSVGNVYAARSRVMKRIKENVQHLAFETE